MGWKKKRAKEQAVKEEQKPRVDVRLVLIGLILIAIALFSFRGYPGNEEGAELRSTGKVAGEYTLFSKVPSTHEAGKVQMVVFFDFYCPHCRDFDNGLLRTIQAKYGSRLVVSHVGYPIFGAKAMNPIRAYELAKDYGKGEEINVAIFEAFHVQKRDISDISVLASIAGEVGLDPEQFRRSLEGGAKNDVVQRNIALAESYDIGQTPLLVLDGQYVVKKISLENLDAIINSLLG